MTILGQILRRSERRETAIYLRDGVLWVADFVDGQGHLVDAESWLRFNCGGASAHARWRMATESAAPVSDDLAERIEALHRAMTAGEPVAGHVASSRLNARDVNIGDSIMVATVRTLDINPTPFFVPPRVGGDREFNGHGPRVEVSATLSVRNANELWASVYMHAKETAHDWTEAEGTAEYLVFRDAQVTRINRIMSDVHSFHGYTDRNHATDLLELPAGELARQFECIGDTRGNEAGIRTGVRVHFNPVTLEVETEPGPIKTIQVDPTPKFIPSHVAGDPEFDGHGPRVEVSASISLQNQTEIWARVRMQGKETRANWTEVAGSTNFMIYRHDRPIAQLVTPTFSSTSYTDVNHDDDELVLGGGGLVERFICTGDTIGQEAGSKTGVVVRFNPISFLEA